MNDSDGSTPQQQIEQILAVTPILSGQHSTEKNPIPPQHQSEPPAYTPAPAPQTSAQAPVPAPAPVSENQPPQPQISHPITSQTTDAAAQPPNSHLPADLQAAQTQNSGQQQKDLEKTLLQTSSGKASEGGLIDFHEGMKKDLPGSGEKARLQRIDTGESVDEFVDAEG